MLEGDCEDRTRNILNNGTCNALVDEAEWDERKNAGPLVPPESQTPWQEHARNHFT